MGQAKRYRMPFQRQEQQGDFITDPNHLVSSPVLVLPPPAITAAAPSPLLGRSMPHPNVRRRGGGGVRYFYYDPSTVSRNAQGNWMAWPQVVYDATTGQAVPWHSLSARWEEPAPPRSIRFHNVTATDDATADTVHNVTHPNTVHTMEHRRQANGGPEQDGILFPPPPLVEDDPRMGRISIPDEYYSWGASHVSDSSVIVVTVGVMALLVGALSARKLRSRNLLSACIENETLEDDAAYDAAYTTHQYNTFQQGWKGDLEKFDV
jgi:hypothetical protein